jgi:hypothetical protein
VLRRLTKMDYHKNNTQEFLEHSYDKVLDRLMQVFPDSSSDSEPDLPEELELIELTKEDEKEIKRWCLRPVARTYVIGMIHTMVDDITQNYEFSEKELDELWANRSGEFTKRSGLASEEGKITLKAAKETFLDDLFDEPVTVSVGKKLYAISRTENGLYVVPEN